MNEYYIALALITIVLAGCTTTGNTVFEDNTIKIGAILPLSAGYGSQNGFNSLRGYQLAVEEINSEGGLLGRNIELVVEDHKGDDTKSALSAYRSLRYKKVDLILGPNYSPLGQAIAPIACQDKSLIISPAIGVKDFAPTCEYIFNLWPVDYENSVTLGKTVVNDGYEHIAVVGSDQSWELEQAKGVRDGILSVNGTIVEYIIVENKASDFATEATKIIHSNADAVIFANYGYMHLFARRLRSMGLTAQFYVVLLDNSRKDPAQGSFENAVIISSFTPTSKFIEKFERRYGVEPDFPADSSYDALMILARAINKTYSLDSKTISHHLLNLDKFEGASGNLTLTSTGDVLKKPVFQTVINDTIR